MFPCAYATLYVFDDDNGEPEHYIEHFCGNATTPPMYSSHEDMLIVFWAGDIGGNGRGFVANYSFIPMQGTQLTIVFSTRDSCLYIALDSEVRIYSKKYVYIF